MQSISRIFISYRREDSAGHTGRLHDRLSARFGRESVFMDIDTIQPGTDFVETIQQAVGSCDVLVAIIGRHWLSNDQTEAGHRLDNQKDFVRVEVGAALAKNIKVIPVLIQGASMPREEELPQDLKSLTRLHALEISDARWAFDTDHLLEAVHKALKPTQFTSKRRSLVMLLAITFVLGIAGGGLYFMSVEYEPTLQKLTTFRNEGNPRDALKQLGLMSIPYSSDEFVSRAEQGDRQAVKLLLDAGMDPNTKNKEGRPALTEAAGKGQKKIVEILLARGADANAIDNDRMTALMRAAIIGHTGITHILLAKGADVNRRGDRDRTALMEALIYRYPDIAKALLAAGADVNAQSRSGGTALMEAAATGQVSIVETLLAKGAHPNLQMTSGIRGRTALMMASNNGHTHIVSALLEHGADPNLKQKDGNTALMDAVRKGDAGIVQALLAKGADVNAERTDGATALTEARKNGSLEVIALLSNAGAR